MHDCWGGLGSLGHDVAHIELPNSFPAPSGADMARAFDQLEQVPADRLLIIDGLAFGALSTARLRSLAAPIVALIHHPLAKETALDPDVRGHLFAVERDNLTLVQHVLVLSPHTAKILTTEYGVDVDRITILRPGTDRPGGVVGDKSDPPMILSVGIQMRRKGHDILLDALAQITDLTWQAVIEGTAIDPEYSKQIEQQCDKLGLTDRVVLAGQVTTDALGGLYRSASLFALATRYEGYGIVFDEALANGLPIVSCATGAVPDTVPEDTQILVAPEDAKAFAGALRRLLEDLAHRADLAQAATQAGQALPSWTDTAQKAAGVLAQVQWRTRRAKPRTAIGRSLDVYYRDKERAARMDVLNAQFIKNGSLAFDIGAHVGDRTGSFLRLGARVVALEPQPDVFRALRLIQTRNGALLLREAVGAQTGQITMHINSANPTVSTLSGDLMTASQGSPDWQGQSWDRTIDVPVTTLDQLIATYGVPDFVKIDVEGFELDVLRGLSRALPCLSFEFTTIQRDVAFACLERLATLGDYRFNYSLGEDHALICSEWITAQDMRAIIAELPANANSGDVFARLI